MQQLQQLRQFAVVAGDDTHDDFKPKYKQEPVDNVKEQIMRDIASNDAFIYMKVSRQSATWLRMLLNLYDQTELLLGIMHFRTA